MTTLNCWKVLEPDNYYRSFINKNERPDKRDWMKARPVTLQVGSIHTAEGSATARLGNTSVICGIKAELAVPDLKHPDEGFIIPNFELYPCCSPFVKPGSPGEKSVATSQFLSNVINSSDLIDRKSLCIASKKVVWCLYCDVVCLDYDGNITDVAVLAMVAALKNTKLPKVIIDPDTERTIVERERTQRLKLQTRPVSTTFLCYSSEIYLLDPTAEDEREANDGEVTIILRDLDNIALVHKSGGHVISPDTFQTFLDVARKRGRYLQKVINDAVKD